MSSRGWGVAVNKHEELLYWRFGLARCACRSPGLAASRWPSCCCLRPPAVSPHFTIRTARSRSGSGAVRTPRRSPSSSEFCSARHSTAFRKAPSSPPRSRPPRPRREAVSRTMWQTRNASCRRHGSDMLQAIKKPTAGMIYAYPVLQPQGARADQILLTAAAAPSLQPISRARRTSMRSTSNCATPPGPRPKRAAISLPIRACLPTSTVFARFRRTAASCWSISGSSMLTLYQDGQPVDSMKVITGTARAADTADRQLHVLHHLQPLLARARSSRAQDDRAELASLGNELFEIPRLSCDRGLERASDHHRSRHRGLEGGCGRQRSISRSSRIPAR